ncbi:MAG: hypothetical protein RMJ87_06395 [Cytophagales bacterium]|nr:hypothetical protein [Bernardetiaceae bacterium]MDW8204641.1 hypothetical protein [Cytophagales bacterium]
MKINRVVCSIALSLLACSPQNNAETEALRQELNAVKADYRAQQEAYREMDSLLVQVGYALDSIAYAGSKLQSERRQLKKGELLERIAAIENYMQQTYAKIAFAQQQASRYRIKAEGLTKALEHLKSELTLQQEKVARLEAELTGARAEVQRLQTVNARKDSMLTVKEELIRSRESELLRTEEARKIAELTSIKNKIEKLLLQADEDLEDANKIWLAIGKNTRKQQLLRQADANYREALSLYDAHQPPGIDRNAIEQKISVVAAKIKTVKP